MSNTKNNGNGNPYNGYGFSEINKGVLDYEVKGIPPKDLGSIYTPLEGEIDWRKVLKQHITNEAEETRRHVTAEVDDAEAKILNKVEEHHQYIVNDLQSKTKSINDNIAGVKSDVASSRTVIDSIRSTVNNISGTVNSINSKV